MRPTKRNPAARSDAGGASEDVHAAELNAAGVAQNPYATQPKTGSGLLARRPKPRLIRALIDSYAPVGRAGAG